MDKDFYAVLNIGKNSSPQEISDDYKICATKSHPQHQSFEDLQHLPGLRQSKTWHLVNEAYDVLNNPETKDVFDRYGEEGLKSGTTYQKPYVYHCDPMKTYNDAFAFERPKMKDGNLEIGLPLDTREVYQGTVKVVQILRRNYDVRGNKTALQEHRLVIPVLAGVSAGTKYLFREEGDQGPTTVPADVIFKVEDVENDIYRREDYVKRIPNEGSPLEQNSQMKGDLLIHFDIIFPAHIPLPIKRDLKQLLEKLPQ